MSIAEHASRPLSWLIHYGLLPVTQAIPVAPTFDREHSDGLCWKGCASRGRRHPGGCRCVTDPTGTFRLIGYWWRSLLQDFADLRGSANRLEGCRRRRAYLALHAELTNHSALRSSTGYYSCRCRSERHE